MNVDLYEMAYQATNTNTGMPILYRLWNKTNNELGTFPLIIFFLF